MIRIIVTATAIALGSIAQAHMATPAWHTGGTECAHAARADLRLPQPHPG